MGVWDIASWDVDVLDSALNGRRLNELGIKRQESILQEKSSARNR